MQGDPSPSQQQSMVLVQFKALITVPYCHGHNLGTEFPPTKLSFTLFFPVTYILDPSSHCILDLNYIHLIYYVHLT